MPLAIITGYGDLLERGSYRSEEEKEIYIDKICKNIHHLNHTFRMILDEQPEEHQQEYQMVDLRSVVQEVADQVCEYVQSHMIRITVNGSREHIYIHGSEMELMRIFHNLIENSVKYMKHGDAIYITIEQVGQDAIVIYRDNGEGISSEEAEVVVEQGRQGSNVTNQNYHEGSGTGLYLVNEIVKKHSGSMEIRSSEGKGFAVYLTFPTVAMTEKPVVEESLRNL
jgi:signal transduction histidine kinase